MIDLDDPTILRRFKGEEGPPLAKEVADMSAGERLTVFFELRRRVILERYGCEPSFERVSKLVRREL